MIVYFLGQTWLSTLDYIKKSTMLIIEDQDLSSHRSQYINEDCQKPIHFDEFDI